MKLPLGNRVLVLPEQVKEITSGGIILPNTTNAPFKGGIVVSVGDRCTVLKKGDQVNFPRNAGSQLSADEELLIMTEDDVWWLN